MTTSFCQEQVFWARLNQAVSSFCLETTLARHEPEKIVCSLVGDGMACLRFNVHPSSVDIVVLADLAFLSLSHPSDYSSSSRYVHTSVLYYNKQIRA